MEPCQKHKHAQRERQKLHSTRPRKNGSSRLQKQKSRRKRGFVVDSRASIHVVSKKDLNSAELETMRTSRSPTTVMMATGDVQTREEATVYVKELDLFVTVMLLEETPAVLSVRKLCEDHGFSYHWTSGQKTHLTKKGKRIDCNVSNYVPSVVPGSSTSSSTTPTPTSSSSSSQNSVFDENRYTENSVPERSGSTSEELRGNPLHRPTETQNKSKNEGRQEVQSDLLHDLPDWLQDFRENWVGERSPTEPRVNPEPGYRDTSSSSHELPMESRAKVASCSGKHSVYTHIPKDPNCDICFKTKITRASSRRRAGTVVPRAENFDDLITADHKILSEESDHRYFVVVQDLATQWLQSLHCKTKNSQETQKKLANEVPGTRRGNQKSFTLTIPWNSAKLVKISPGIIARLHHTDRRLM